MLPRGRGAIDLGSDVPGELRFSTSIASQVLESSSALRATVSSDSEALELGRSVFDLKLRAAMCVPLAAGREKDHIGAPPIGVLYVDSRAATRRFSQSDLSVLRRTRSAHFHLARERPSAPRLARKKQARAKLGAG